eukprot:217741-Hanusia_phi.AAC.2
MAPVVLENFPGSQSVQLLLPLVELNSPGAHKEHEVLALPPAKEPAEQLEHTWLPPSVLYLPGTQDEHEPKRNSYPPRQTQKLLDTSAVALASHSEQTRENGIGEAQARADPLRCSIPRALPRPNVIGGACGARSDHALLARPLSLCINGKVVAVGSGGDGVRGRQGHNAAQLQHPRHVDLLQQLGLHASRFSPAASGVTGLPWLGKEPRQGRVLPPRVKPGVRTALAGRRPELA